MSGVLTGEFCSPGPAPGRSGAVPRGARRRRALLAAGPPRSLRRCSPSREQRAGTGAVRYQEKGHKIAPVPVLSAFTTGSCISISAVIIIYHHFAPFAGTRDLAGTARAVVAARNVLRGNHFDTVVSTGASIALAVLRPPAVSGRDNAITVIACR